MVSPVLLLLLTPPSSPWRTRFTTTTSAFSITPPLSAKSSLSRPHPRGVGDDGIPLLLGRPRSSSSSPSPSSHHPSTTKSSATRRRSLPLSSELLADGASAFLGGMNDGLLSMDQSAAERIAGPFFGASLFPYLGFLYFLDVPQSGTPRGVSVGFATCLLFVFLTIPAAIAAKVWYDASLADCDWLHGSAESLLAITNLVTVLAFRRALGYEERRRRRWSSGGDVDDDDVDVETMPESYASYVPMMKLVGVLTFLALLTALYPAVATTGGGGALVHTPYLNGFLDVPPASSIVLPPWWTTTPPHPEPENALTVATWIIHISSLVEFLVAMGYCWRWAEVSGNPKWKGLTWGLIPLHTSGITACTYHLLYNSVPVLVPLQAALTFLGNTTAMYAAYRIAISNGWTVPSSWGPESWSAYGDAPFVGRREEGRNNVVVVMGAISPSSPSCSSSLVGFEDLGDALAEDDDYSFIAKLFAGCAVAR